MVKPVFLDNYFIFAYSGIFVIFLLLTFRDGSLSNETSFLGGRDDGPAMGTGHDGLGCSGLPHQGLANTSADCVHPLTTHLPHPLVSKPARLLASI